MEQENQMSSENPSLLILNDDCLGAIFKFLQLNDYVNLAETCSRLLFLAQEFSKKYKNIQVYCADRGSHITEQEFSNSLSMIGEHVVSVCVSHRQFGILKIIADSCSNLRSVNLCYTGSVMRQFAFRCLKELQIWADVYLSTDNWTNCFTNNPGIENLQCVYYRHGNCIPLLKMLPKLKSLSIENMEPNSGDFRHLSCLTNLTKFSFSSHYYYNRLLLELAETLNLVELGINMPCNVDTFPIFKFFPHLEVLSMHSRLHPAGLCHVPETTIFPSMLKRIEFNNITISCNVFLSIVKQLTILEEFDFGRGMIFCYNDKYDNFPNRPCQPGDIEVSKIFSRITKELRIEKRKLKIIFKDWCTKDDQVCMYSDNLEIIINRRNVKSTFDHTFRVK